MSIYIDSDTTFHIILSNELLHQGTSQYYTMHRKLYIRFLKKDVLTKRGTLADSPAGPRIVLPLATARARRRPWMDCTFSVLCCIQRPPLPLSNICAYSERNIYIFFLIFFLTKVSKTRAQGAQDRWNKTNIDIQLNVAFTTSIVKLYSMSSRRDILRERDGKVQFQ